MPTLREQYGAPLERARLKTLRKLDKHCRRFIELSPFVCLETTEHEWLWITTNSRSHRITTVGANSRPRDGRLAA